MIKPSTKISFPAMFAAEVMKDSTIPMATRLEVANLAIAIATKHEERKEKQLEELMEAYKLQRHWLVAHTSFYEKLENKITDYKITHTIPAWEYLQSIPPDQLCCLHAIKTRHMSDGMHITIQNTITIGEHIKTKECSLLKAMHLVLAIKEGLFEEKPVVYIMKNNQAHFIRKIEIRQWIIDGKIETQTFVVTDKEEWRLTWANNAYGQFC